MKKMRNEKGAITLFVLVSIILFLILLMSTYTIIVNRASAQKRMQEEIAKTYGTQDAEEIYNSYFNTGEVIPIYNSYQLSKIASGDKIQINERNGQVYTFKPEYTYVLMNDIDVNAGKYTVATDGTITFNEGATQWTPLPEFSGTFDGLNHKISGMYINSTSNDQAMFGINKGTIKNVNLDKCSITGADNVAGIVSENYGTIDSCSNAGIITNNGTNNIGGIAGKTYNNSTIKNCYNKGKIIGKVNTAGIVGQIENKVVIEKCWNNGKISGTVRVGGIVGYATSNNNAEIKISNCYNEENIIGSAVNNTTDTHVYTGGIVGLIENTFTIKECNNSAKVEGDAIGVGGIAGATYSSAANIYIGIIENCYNDGYIYNSKNQTGGIIGTTMGSNTRINKCYNSGIVETGTYYSGGITGFLGYTTPGYVSNCYNAGTIKSTVSFSGGIVGKLYSGKIENSYNIGEVGANTYIGGVLGISESSSTYEKIVTNCYYLTGTATGGINGADAVGQAEEKSATYMMSSNFVDELGNTNWKLVRNKNYPVLSWENGEAYTNYTYVQDGLILWYDAIDNLGTGEHSTTTTAWKDLSINGNNGELNNFNQTSESGWGSNGLSFDGVEDWVLTPLTEISETFTMEIVVKIPGVITKSQEYILNFSPGGGTSYMYNGISLTGNKTMYIESFGPYNSNPITYEPYIGKRVLFSICATKNDLSEFYVNGEEKLAYTSGDIYSDANGNFVIGDLRPNIDIRFVGEICSIRIYNRHLTETEVKQNSNVDKTRYGL